MPAQREEPSPKVHMNMSSILIYIHTLHWASQTWLMRVAVAAAEATSVSRNVRLPGVPRPPSRGLAACLVYTLVFEYIWRGMRSRRKPQATAVGVNMEPGADPCGAPVVDLAADAGPGGQELVDLTHTTPGEASGASAAGRTLLAAVASAVVFPHGPEALAAPNTWYHRAPVKPGALHYPNG